MKDSLEHEVRASGTECSRAVLPPRSHIRPEKACPTHELAPAVPTEAEEHPDCGMWASVSGPGLAGGQPCSRGPGDFTTSMPPIGSVLSLNQSKSILLSPVALDNVTGRDSKSSQ